MQINFRVKYFNADVYKLIHGIYHKAHQNQIILKEDLQELHNAFVDYYKFERRDYSDHEKIQRANEVYSQFLQNLFYYCVHNIKNEQYINNLFETILVTEDYYIFYKSYFDKKSPAVVIWQDHEEKCNILHSLCRGNYTKIVSLIFKKLKMLLNENQYKALLNSKDKLGFSPLNSAARFGNLETCKLMLEEAYVIFRNDLNGFNLFLTQKDNYEFIPLLSACKAGHFQVVELLLKFSIIHQFSLFDSIPSPLPTWDFLKQRLANTSSMNFERNIQALKTMLRYNGNDGYTSIIAACKHDNINTLNQILMAASIIFKNDKSAHKAFLSNPNKYGFSALITAVKTNSFPLVDQLLKEAETIFSDDLESYKKFLSQEMQDGSSSLSFACSSDDARIFNKLFLAFFSAWNILPLLNLSQDAVQQIAIEFSHFKKIQLSDKQLTEIKNILMRQNGQGYSLLISACKEGRLVIVKQLLAVAAVNAHLFKKVLQQENNEGYSPLISACKEGRLEVVKEILSIVSSDYQLLEFLLSQKNKMEFTALITACSDGYVGIVNLLLETTAKLFKNKPHCLKNALLQQNKYGFTPLISAAKGGFIEIVKVLIKFAFDIYGCSNLIDKVFEQYQGAFKLKDLNVINEIYDTNIKGLKYFLTQQNHQQYSALNTAASSNFFDIVCLLLITARVVFKDDSAGFNKFLEQQNNFGFTPLNIAVKNGAKQIAEKLYAEGADPDIQNTSKFTARINQPKDWNIFSSYTPYPSHNPFIKVFDNRANSTFSKNSNDGHFGSRKRKLEDSSIRPEHTSYDEKKPKLTHRY